MIRSTAALLCFVLCAPLSSSQSTLGVVGEFEGAASGDLIGFSVGDAGDVDGDGVRDLIIGGPGQGVGGAALVISGATSTTIQAASLAVSGADFGASVDGVGDIIALVASRPSSIPFAAVTFLVDLTPGQVYLPGIFRYDMTGSASFPVVLSQPALAGATLVVQGFEVSGLAPMNLFASNGVEVLFCQ